MLICSLVVYAYRYIDRAAPHKNIATFITLNIESTSGDIFMPSFLAHDRLASSNPPFQNALHRTTLRMQ